MFFQFNCYIPAIQFVIHSVHSIQFSYSFNSIRLYSFNLRSHLFNLGFCVKRENLSVELGLRVKMAEEMYEDEDSEGVANSHVDSLAPFLFN